MMAPREKVQTQPPGSQMMETRGDATSQEASQDVDTNAMQDALKQHKINVRQRRREVKSRIMKSNHVRMAEVHTDMESTFNTFDDTLREIRREKMQRLVKLGEAKEQLVAKLRRCETELHRGFKAMSQQLQVAYEARLEEFEL